MDKPTTRDEAAEFQRKVFNHLTQLYSSGETGHLTRRLTWKLDDADRAMNVGNYDEGVKLYREAYKMLKEQVED